MVKLSSAQRSEELISFYKHCYREDSSDLSLFNVDKLGPERLIQIDDADVLANGELTYYVLVDSDLAIKSTPNSSTAPKKPQTIAQKIKHQADLYRKERMLIYGCLMISGKLQNLSGFVKNKNVHAPLLYFPANISLVDDEQVATIVSDDLRINVSLLRQILKPDIETSVVDTFPIVKWPITKTAVSKIEDWLSINTTIEHSEHLVYWPSATSSKTANNTSHSASKTPNKMTINSNCCVVLVDRSRGSRGIIHELSSLLSEPVLSTSLHALFTASDHAKIITKSDPDLLPCALSAAQTEALKSAASFPLSMLSGPPGTGKSYTIAAMAIDHVLQGESIIIAAKTGQAVDVIGHLLKNTFGITAGFVCANEHSFAKTMKQYLDSLLTEGVESSEDYRVLQKELKKERTHLRGLVKKYKRLLWSFRHNHSSNPWLKKALASLYLSMADCQKLWQIQAEIEHTQVLIEQLAKQYINAYRNHKLRTILLHNRQALVKFQSSLRARTSKVADERFAATDFDIVLKAFPIWVVPIDEVNRVLPFSNELFDLAIVDEATQCDVASALPVLQRAKRACIVGDLKQLRHVSFLSKAKQDLIKKRCLSPENMSDNLSYRDQSILDITSDGIPSQQAVSMLNEHYRSKPELIAFSNAKFYNAKLLIMQARPSVNDDDSLQFIKLEGKRTQQGRNKIEHDAIVAKISILTEQYQSCALKPSIGVLSPFREQAEYLERTIHKQFSSQILEEFNIKIATPYGFQGEERDFMLLSFAIDNNSARAAAYLNRPDMFNVAITRAKQAQIVYYSIDSDWLTTNNLLKQFLNFDHKGKAISSTNDTHCQFAKEVRTYLESLGANVWESQKIAGQDVDILASLNGKVLAIDLIGFPGDYEAYSCLTTYEIFKRAKVEFLPIPYSTWKKDVLLCQHKLKECLL